MFDSDLGTNEGSVVRRRAFLLTSGSALAGAILWSLRRPSPVQAKAAKAASEEVTIVEFSDSGVRRRQSTYRKWSRRKGNGASNCPEASSQSPVRPTPSLPILESTGTSTRKVFIAASVVTMRCSPRIRRSIPERVGRVFGRRSRLKTSEPRETPAWAWSEGLSHAASATHIWDTYSTMVPNLRVCAIA